MNILYLHVCIIYVYMVRLKPKPKNYILELEEGWSKVRG